MSEMMRAKLALIWKMYNLEDIPTLSWVEEEMYPTFVPAADTTVVEPETVAENVTWIG